MIDENEDTPAMDELDEAGAARRDVLKRLGIYSAVTAPVLLGALKAEPAVAQTGPGIPGGGGIGPGGGFTVF